ncbi:MAG: YHS domain-containing (seleno)protein [Minwuia sp.]|uniref:YHS domain-containing (seleno)protein n=1 Tax=Minwuia sp. TaxID=2493630 RepID=UPI003A837575
MLLGLIFVLVAAGASADDIRPKNLDADGVVMKGYDVVVYRDGGTPMPGRSDITAEHDGAVYRFVSEANRAAFVADPAAYAPSYGGYCAFGVLMGEKVDIDPTHYRFVDGRLLVFFSGGTKSQWVKKPAENLALSDQVWERIRDVPQSRLPLKE